MVDVKQYFLGCLSQASYVIVSDGIAAVIDPRRDVELYEREAAELGAQIRFVIETHLHADFVSGHRELAARNGAAIYAGARAEATFPHVAVRDGDELAFGRCLLRFLETPGHTLDSICVLAVDLDRPGEPLAVFTGDTLFVGDVGRPDLGGDRGAEDLAGMLYDSLRSKLLPLPDGVTVYPGHGAGSLCGRAMRTERTSTIGEERRSNAALQATTRDAFVAAQIADLPERPGYFARTVELNRGGARALSDLAPLAPLDPVALRAARDGGAVVLDTRDAELFGASHVPGSVNVGLDGQFAAWAATVLGSDAEIVLVADDEARAHEARTRLARVGLERVSGFLSGGIDAWTTAGLPVGDVQQIDAEAIYAGLLAHDEFTLVDVRRPAERRAGYVCGSLHLPLDRLGARLRAMDSTRWTAAYCKGGYRSSTACSLMRRGGLRVMNVRGGFDAWLARSLPFTTAPETRDR